MLVRLLTPADFGLIALATSFSQSVDWLSTIGVREALIRRHTLTRSLYDTGFTLNALRGVLMALAILAMAWPVAGFFDDARLFPILLVLAGVTMLSALENIGTVDFRRDLAFGREFWMAVIPRIGAIVVSMTLAFVLRNFWALIGGILTAAVMRLAMSYIMHPYRPGLTLRDWRGIAGFSFWTWMTATAQLLRDKMDTVVIGRVLGPRDVGLYAVGVEVGSLTSSELVEPLTAALFAGFTEARRKGADIAAGYFKAIAATFLVTMPMGLGLSMLAAPLVRLAFGEAWMEAVPLVQIFALMGMAKVVAYVSTALLTAEGMMRQHFRVMVTSLVARAILLAVLIGPFGIMGAVWATIGSIVVEEILYMIVTFRHFRLPLADLPKTLWRPSLAGAAMACVLMLQGLAWTAAPDTAAEQALAMLQGTLTGAVTYTSVLLLAWYAAGRPAGAETAFLDVFMSQVRRIARRSASRS